MLTVSTFLDKSAIHGIGLFANEDIPEGTVIWKFNPYFDYKFSKTELLNILSTINKFALEFLFTYSYKMNDNFYYITDNARFINHSDEGYNLKILDETTEVSLRDIQKGEELIENYALAYDKDDYFFLEDKYPSVYDYIEYLKKSCFVRL